VYVRLSSLTCIAERSSESSQGIQPLDRESLNSATSRERRNDSSQQVRLVVIDAMPVEKGLVLSLKSLSTVVFTFPSTYRITSAAGTCLR
jgi:hypothetical protein